LRRARAGDQDAAAELFRRILPQAREVARARLGPRNPVRAAMDSEDVLQAALLRAWRAFGEAEARTPAEFVAWLARIVENTIRDGARAEGREKRDAARRAAPDASESALLSSIPARGATPSEVLMGAELAERYFSALHELPERSREAILLRRHQGASFVEIA